MLWWLAFFTALGLCIGSFANVLIYRLPLGQSIREPRWSHCPHCATRIRWRDNLPVIGYLLLKGRCRNCRLPISIRYPVIEALVALVFLALADAFLIDPSHPGLRPTNAGATERLLTDWPILTAHLILFACLFVMSAIDLEHYWVDIRFSSFAAAAGFALHAVWTPAYSLATWPRPGTTFAAVSFAVIVGLGAVWILRIASLSEADSPEEETPPQEGAAPSPSRYVSRRPSSRMPLVMLVALIAVCWVMSCLEVFEVRTGGAAARLALVCGGLFAALIWAGRHPQESDEQIVETLEEESVDARRLAGVETLIFVPAVVYAVLVVIWLQRDPTFSGGFEALLMRAWAPGETGAPATWRPLLGLATAGSGFVIGGALGWAVRLGFTLLFGKEAFGVGDIHMMAAAGCIAGWPVVVIGFFLACFLAMLGWVATLPFKRTAAIPLGPWLSLSFLITVLFYRPITESRMIVNFAEAVKYFL